LTKTIVLATIILSILSGVNTQSTTDRSIDFNKSEFFENTTNKAGEFVIIRFYAQWNNGEPFVGNDSVMVYFGADITTYDYDWYLESTYDIDLKCFYVNFTLSEKSMVIFYIDSVEIDFKLVNFTQTADNIKLFWLDQEIEQDYNSQLLSPSVIRNISLLAGAIIGIVCAIVIHRES